MPAASVLVLENPIQHYAWGSRAAIAELLGRPSPATEPEAELWIGAHPRAPSRIVEPPGLGTLDAAIQDDPVGLLGPDVCDRFGNELPFLLKVLAAAEPLSIQAHPNHEQARRGWSRENADGIPTEAPHRNYPDPNHKPELVCALSSFTAMKGFSPPEVVARQLQAVAGAELQPELGRLSRERTPASLRALFARLMTLEPEERTPVLQRTAREAARRAADPAWGWVKRLLARYPDDLGVLSPLYLNVVTLAPGQALFLQAGELHAYLEGSALEIMANSDNVLRGGLTPKHVDVPELLAILSFEPGPPEVLASEETGPGERILPTPAREFEMGFLEITPERSFASATTRGAEILLTLEGEPRLDAEGTKTALGRGRSVFVPASLSCYTVEGDGRVCRARVPA
jgi:mannose-6-phosphate isomerase